MFPPLSIHPSHSYWLPFPGGGHRPEFFTVGYYLFNKPSNSKARRRGMGSWGLLIRFKGKAQEGIYAFCTHSQHIVILTALRVHMQEPQVHSGKLAEGSLKDGYMDIAGTLIHRPTYLHENMCKPLAQVDCSCM